MQPREKSEKRANVIILACYCCSISIVLCGVINTMGKIIVLTAFKWNQMVILLPNMYKKKKKKKCF